MSSARIPAATTTMQQPPSSPTRTRGTPTTPEWPWPTTPTLPRPGAPSRPPPLSAVLRSASEGPVAWDMAGRNEDIPDAVSRLRHSRLDGVPHVRDLHLGAYTPCSPPREWGLVPMPAPSTAQFIPPPYALEMCLHLPAGVHYYRVCSGTDSWPRDILSLVGAVHCVQVSGSHQIQLCRKGMPPTSLILPEHHHVVLPQSLHSRVSVTATGLTRASVLAIAATYHPRHLRKWVRGLPHALPAAVVRKLTRHPATAGSRPDPPLSNRASPRPDIMTLNVQMSLRPKLRALDVLVRECQYLLTLHLQEAGPLIVQRVHPLYHTIQAPAKVAGGCATLLYRTPDLAVTSHSAHPSGRALITHFTMAGVAHCHANVYFPADGDLDTLQEILDWVYPYLLLTPARVVVLTGALNANCHRVSHLPISPASLCDLVLPTLARLGMRRLHPLAEAPTWVSPQGFAGALDHIFLRTPSEAAHTTEVRSDSSFPSDHLPVTATLHDLPPAPQLVCPSKKGRFPIPREPLASQLRTLNDSFRAELTPPPPGAPSALPRYTEVTSTLYTAAAATFGPPVPSQPVPSTVRVHVTNQRRYTLAHPDWASQSSHLVEVARLKEQIRAAWDVILLEKDVGLAPLPTACGQPPKWTTAALWEHSMYPRRILSTWWASQCHSISKPPLRWTICARGTWPLLRHSRSRASRPSRDGPAARSARRLALPSPTYAPSSTERRPPYRTTICWSTGCSDSWRTPSLWWSWT